MRRRIWIRWTEGWEEPGFSLASMEAKESEIMRKTCEETAGASMECFQDIEEWPGVQL